MKTKLIKDAKFKNGEVWGKGTQVLITINQVQPRVALICKVNDLDNVKRMASIGLINFIK